MTSVPSLDDDLQPVDGRTARAVRTRAAIVEACIELIEAGDLRPTAPRIAERADVSVRSVFQHFVDLDTLFSAVGERVMERSSHLVVPIDPDLDLGTRIDAIVAERARLLEALTPIRRSAMVHQADSSQIARMFAEVHQMSRGELKVVFTTELGSMDEGRRELLDALDVVLSWGSWVALRESNDRTPAEAQAALGRMVRWVFVGSGVVTTW